MDRFRPLTAPFEVKITDATVGAFEGYGSVYDVVDAGHDLVEPGAFAASLAEHKARGTMPAMYWHHRPDQPIGTWERVAEDARGLFVAGRLALDTAAGRRAYAQLKAGAARGLSIGYRAQVFEVDRRRSLRRLREVDLVEVSLTPSPMNAHAVVTEVKAAGLVQDLRRLAAIIQS